MQKPRTEEWNFDWPWHGIIAAFVVWLFDVHMTPGYGALLLLIISGRYSFRWMH